MFEKCKGGRELVWVFEGTLQTVSLTRGSMMISYLVEECFTVMVIKSLL